MPQPVELVVDDTMINLLILTEALNAGYAIRTRRFAWPSHAVATRTALAPKSLR